MKANSFILKNYSQLVCRNKINLKKIKSKIIKIPLSNFFKIKLNSIFFDFKSTYASNSIILKTFNIDYKVIENLKYYNSNKIIANATLCFNNKCETFYVYKYNLEKIKNLNNIPKFKIINTIKSLFFYKAYNYFNPAKNDKSFLKLLDYLKNQIYCQNYIYYLYQNITVSENEVKNFFENNKKLLKVSAKADFFILIYEKKQIAQEVWKFLKKNENKTIMELLQKILKQYPPKRINSSIIEEGKNPILDFLIFKKKRKFIFLKDKNLYFIIIVNKNIPEKLYSFSEVRDIIYQYLKIRKIKKILNLN